MPYPAPILSQEDYDKRLAAAKDLASISQASKNAKTPDGQTPSDYAKIIFSGATWVTDEGQISLSIRMGEKEATANRQIEMYLLGYACVRGSPEQTISYLQYIDQQYAKAYNVELDAPGQNRLARAQAGLAVFGLNVLQDFAKLSPPPTPQMVGALLNTLMVSAGLGSLGAGESGPSSETRQSVLDALHTLLQSDAPQTAILAARAMRMFNYESLGQKQESVGLILKELAAHPSWTLAEQRLMLEEAVRLDIRLEWGTSSERVFNTRDPAEDPDQVMAWLSSRPELAIHALMVASAQLAPLTSFDPGAARAAADPNALRLDGTATYRWMAVMQSYSTGIFGLHDGKPFGSRDEAAISKFKNDRSLSKDYEPPFSSMPLSTLYLSLLDRIRRSASRFAPDLSTQAWADYNEFNKLLK
ncbi:Uncharacterised protein [uncultured archaeon]|nr:Uncharacterised protein [uncultured archaeon]